MPQSCWELFNTCNDFMGSRVEIEELQVVPMAAVYLAYFREKTILFLDLVKYLLF